MSSAQRKGEALCTNSTKQRQHSGPRDCLCNAQCPNRSLQLKRDVPTGKHTEHPKLVAVRATVPQNTVWTAG